MAAGLGWSRRAGGGGSPCSSSRRAISGWAPRGPPSRRCPGRLLLYGVLGGTAGLYVGLRERWWETRFLAFSGGWVLLAAASERMGLTGRYCSPGSACRRRSGGTRSGTRECCRSGRGRARPGGWSLGEALYFFTTPVLLGWAAYGLAPDRFDRVPGLLGLLVAIPYLMAGYVRPRPPFARSALPRRRSPRRRSGAAPRRVGAVGLALLWAALDHVLDRADGRWYACLTWAAALNQLMNEALAARTAGDTAFTGSWALALWGVTGVAVALAGGF